MSIKLILLAALACASISVGCKNEQAIKPDERPAELGQLETQPQFRSGNDGKAILRDLIDRYATAKSYKDKAVLYLSYQLEGRNIQEPQRWSTTWDAAGRMATQLFNGHVRCDGQLLSCYVYDIETANLDDQHLLMPYDQQLPINQLFRDSIAKHFLGGYSELPLDESDLIMTPKLIPPPISLLTNQVRNGWLQNPTQVQRLGDEVIDDRMCFVIRCLSEGMTSDVWIDQETHTLVQMSLPLKLLAGEVVTSPEITDVVLIAKFHEAVFDGPVADEEFAIKPRPDSTPVLKYVSLPEKLPSELIGQTSPSFNLIGRDRKLKGRQAFEGKVTALLWLAGKPSYSALQELDSLAKTLPPATYNFGAVYSDAELQTPGSASVEVGEDLAKALQAVKTPAYYDPMLAASSALKIKAIPSVIVLDANSKIQYVKALSDTNWLADVKAAVERVANGDDLATEMQQEYQRFVESYHQQLATVSAKSLVEDSQPSGLQASSNRVRGVRSGGVRLRPEKLWANPDFKQAGNVATTSHGDLDQSVSSRTDAGAATKFENQAQASATAYLVFDGWRTVVELGPNGQENKRVNLELPEGAAANLIRVGSDANGNRRQAVFSALGKKVFLFDQDWNPIGAYPADDLNHSGIRDCQLTDLNADGASELVVSFDDGNGIHLVDIGEITSSSEPVGSLKTAGEKISGALIAVRSSELAVPFDDPDGIHLVDIGEITRSNVPGGALKIAGEKISGAVATSLAQFGGDVVITGQGKIGMLKTGLTNVEETELQFRRVATRGHDLICGLGATSNGQWNAVGFDSKLKRIWTLSIGSQFFESEIEPVAVVQAVSGEFVWAIADTENAIHLVSGNGKWLGDFQSESQLAGVALANHDGQVRLTVSNKTGVECWDLNLISSPMKPVSSRK